MTAQTVDISVQDTSLAADPIVDVLVRVYTADGASFITQSSTDGDGRVGFLLEPALYQMRFYKRHVGFQNPIRFVVVDAATVAASNSFDVKADLVAPPTATDRRLCTAFGYFRQPDGSPAANVDVHFIAKFRPILLDGDAVLTPQLMARTDALGYMQINLIRCGMYDVTVQGIDDTQRCITVPDAPNVNLPDLLLPVVDRIVFDPPGPYTILNGQELVVTPTVLSSDGNEVDFTEVQWSSSDTTIMAVLPGGGMLTLRSVGPGTADIQAVRSDQTIIRIPDTPIDGVPLSVTVT